LREFETTFVIQPEISDEGCQALFDRLDGILGQGNATRLIFDDQGKRKLAYDIRKFQKGRYVTLSYFDTGRTVPELERALRLDESVLRFLTVRVADEVTDIEGRKRAAEEEERQRAVRAAERAVREAEERAAREKEEAEARAEAARRGESEDEDEDGSSDAGDEQDEEETDE
jgi:small subunit ribosomal protein S6